MNRKSLDQQESHMIAIEPNANTVFHRYAFRLFDKFCAFVSDNGDWTGAGRKT
jgi:hypothetical protein